MTPPLRVEVLGGGISALAAAWWLTEAPCPVRVRIWQPGWRLGGKGASGRDLGEGQHLRILEHGPHIWGGFYHHAFGLMRGAFAELDRPAEHPQATVWQAFRPATSVVLMERWRGVQQPWTICFPTNRLLPGHPGGSAVLPVAELILGAAQIGLSARTGQAPAFSAAWPPGPDTPEDPPGAPSGERLMAAAAALLRALGPDGDRDRRRSRWLATTLRRLLQARWARVQPHLDDPTRRRRWVLEHFAVAHLLGAVTDGLFEQGCAVLDGHEYRQWLSRHLIDDAVPEAGFPEGLTLGSPWVSWVYDALFAYRQGDRSQPDLEASLALRSAGRMLLGCRGATYWRMQGGMGDVVFAPLYQALLQRGVDFRFFHRADALRLDSAGTGLQAIDLTRQARVKDGHYNPFIDVGGLPCWPDRPLAEQLEEGRALEAAADALEAPTGGPSCGSLRLERGRDFDIALSGLPLGVLPHVAEELVERLPRWRALVEGVPTVATRAAQVWLDRTDAQLGAPGPPRAIVHQHDAHHSIATDMSQTLSHEPWDKAAPARSAIYLCDPLDETQGPSGDAKGRLMEDLAGLYPEAAQDGEGLSARLKSRYQRENRLGGDRFTHPAAGSTALRLSADESGVQGLILAGDWVKNGFDLICIEGAVMSGLQAARAITGHPDAAAIARPLGGLG